ncbi:hypothetical protein LKO27_04370 [Tessaracoccus sp. OS52]|uniref:hypothetical protein n=1 Tax=Tessaracoccus sp. OS52 TaxID=2886691 RepID=UPI001D12F5FA|nr:hypothetical protein [Tessaracoccus sp. OS52]MCC2592651.1 hypothetical protein [Tessaracoccus sp. OS52]
MKTPVRRHDGIRSAVLNLLGAFLSVEVALTVTNAVVNIQDSRGAPRTELLPLAREWASAAPR